MGERLNAALVALRQIFRQTEEATRSLAKQHGLTPTQLACLQVIEGDDAATPSTVARALSIGPSTVTALVDRLEEADMIARRREDHDRRRVFLVLRPAGRAALGATPGSLQHRFERRFEELEGWEKAFLLAALERIAGFLEADELEAAPILATGDLAAVPGEGEAGDEG